MGVAPSHATQLNQPARRTRPLPTSPQPLPTRHPTQLLNADLFRHSFALLLTEQVFPSVPILSPVPLPVVARVIARRFTGQLVVGLRLFPPLKERHSPIVEDRVPRPVDLLPR